MNSSKVLNLESNNPLGSKVPNVLICIVVTIIVFGIDLTAPLGIAGGVLNILAIFISLRSCSTKVTISIAVICTFFVGLGFVFSPGGTAADTTIVIINRIISGFSIWLTAVIGIFWIRREEAVTTYSQQNDDLNLKLKTSEEMFKGLFQQAMGYFMILEPHPSGVPTILDLNQTACVAHGYAREEMIGRPVADLDDEEGKKLCIERTKQIISGNPLRIETNHIRKDGSSFPVSVCANLVEFKNRSPLIFSTEMDISHVKKAIEEKSTAKAQNNAKSKFLAQMSHEIRTPVAAIGGYSDLLISDIQTDEQSAGYLNAIRRNCRHLTTMVENILNLSKIEAGEIVLDNRIFSLRMEIENVVSMISLLAKQKFNSLRVAYTEPVPDSVVCDPIRLRQILVNVLSNSIKFTENGSIDLEVQYVMKESKEAGHLVFVFKDTGVGIADCYQKSIFDSYNRGDHQYQGTGLGLSLSRELAERMGGSLVLDWSELGKGSAFKLTIPITIPADASEIGTQ